MPVLLTSNLDSQILDLYIPFEFEIVNRLKDTVELNHVAINRCDSVKKYMPLFKSSSKALDYDYNSFDTKIKPNSTRKFIFYSYYGIAPFGDSIKSKVKQDNLLREEYNQIKKYCNKSTNFKNDTIKYISLVDFRKQHLDCYNEKVSNVCEEVTVRIYYFDKFKKKIVEPNLSFVIKRD